METLRPLLHVGVVLLMSGSITPAQMTELRAEAERVWQPYGVALTWLDGHADCALASHDDWSEPADIYVSLTAEEGRASLEYDRRGLLPPLGSVLFHANVPDRTVHLAYRPVQRMVMGAHVSGWSVALLPPPRREQFLGRALGRVFAHELGHVLLGTRAHADAGLMRATFSAADLVVIDRVHMRLNRELMQRLVYRIETGLADTVEPAPMR